MPEVSWFKRRWMEFRQGYSTYLNLPLSLISFITVVYSLAVIQLSETFPLLLVLFPNILVFAFVCVIIIPFIAVAIGHIHVKKQIMTDSIMAIKPNLYIVEQAKAWYALVVATGVGPAIEYFEKSLAYIDVDFEKIKQEVEESAGKNQAEILAKKG